MIELLTVIAVIGILAAIIFPVMGVARERARQTQCITNMNEIARALKLFKNDNGRYPPSLGGYAESGKPFDAARADSYLFGREYISAAKTFHCPNDRFQDPTAVAPDPLGGTNLIGLDRPGGNLYMYDSYDMQTPSYSSSPQPRYVLAWADTPNDVPVSDPALRDEAFERQLKFRTPPDNTVVTWCSYHRGGDQNPARSGAQDLVLFLDGHVDRIGADVLYPGGASAPWNFPYTVKPKL